MDKEACISPQTSKAERSQSSNKLCCFVVLALLLCVIFSSAALVVSTLTFYNNQLRTNLQPLQMDMPDDPNWKNQVLSDLETVFEKDGNMKFNTGHRNRTHPKVGLPDTARVRRGADHSAELDDMCNSTSSSGNNSDVKPLAHIVPFFESGSPKRNITADSLIEYDVITKKWICGNPGRRPTPYGFISGGMVFNRTSGFLILPKDGVYYVYSHVLFKLIGSNETYETSAIMVACIPGGQCDFVEVSGLQHYRFLESNGVAGTFTHRQMKTAKGDHGVYQGGLFHFPAGTQISLLVKNPKAHLGREERKTLKGNKLFTSELKENSYMGAFLVQ